MKKLITLILFGCIFAGSASAQTVAHKRFFTHTTPSTEIAVYYPEFTEGRFADSLNKEMLDFYYRTNSGKNYPRPTTAKEMEAMWVFTGDTLAKMGMKRSIDPIKYTNLGGWMLFENKYLTSFVVASFNILGQGFPENNILNLNYDNVTGKRFDPRTMVLDTMDIMEDVADIFCKERKLSRNTLRLETGLKYELADLPMPKNIAFGNDGILLIYRKGEIAPRSMPAILITVPYSKIDRGLPADFFNTRHTLESGFHELDKRAQKLDDDSRKYYRPKKVIRH